MVQPNIISGVPLERSSRRRWESVDGADSLGVLSWVCLTVLFQVKELVRD
jgi:hypothetical protein